MQKLPLPFSEKLKALRACGYFNGLSEVALSEIAQATNLLQFDRNESIFWQGETCPGLHILQRGAVKLFRVSPQGRELIVRVLEEGATFGEVPVFDGGPNAVNAAALENSQVCVVDSAAIQRAMISHPEMGQAVVVNLAQNLRMLVNVVEELSFYQVTHRLARLIGQLPREQLGRQAGQRLTQDQMAARLGTVREVVARSLRELERAGAIRSERGQIRITDEDILQQWMQGPG